MIEPKANPGDVVQIIPTYNMGNQIGVVIDSTEKSAKVVIVGVGAGDSPWVSLECDFELTYYPFEVPHNKYRYVGKLSYPFPFMQVNH